VSAKAAAKSSVSPLPRLPADDRPIERPARSATRLRLLIATRCPATQSAAPGCRQYV
jgi:hypothetical protein